MSRGALPAIIYPSTVDELKKRLGASLKGTDTTVQSCGALDNGLRASWGAFYTTVSSWVASETSIWGLGTQMDRGEAYEDELLAWQERLKSANCTLLVPNFDPRKNEKAGDAGGAFTWIGIAVAAVAGAYVVGKVIPLIPRIRLPQRAGNDRDDDRIRVRKKEDAEADRERERRQAERDNAERAKMRAEKGGGGGIRLGGGAPRNTLPKWHGAGEVGIGGQQNWRHGVHLSGRVGSDQFDVKRGGSTIGTISRRPNGSWLYRTPQDEVEWRGSARSRDGAARKVVLAYSW